MSDKRLTNVDLHRMLASGAKLASEAAQLQVETLKGVVNQQAAEIAYLKAQLAMTEANRVSQERLKVAQANRQAAKEAHDNLSTQLAKTYQVDWKTAAFCPDTGEIRPLEGA